MKKESLKENIAKILGVSSLEKELAFEVFLEKVSEAMDYDQAIKIAGLGVFQLKKNVPSKDEQSYIGSTDPKKDKIIYSAFDQKSSRESNSLFLSFDVKAKSKNEFEFDDEIFSPGVGKPIIPINSENEDLDPSIHLIKKSLEERVTELIEESQKVENFDIWDDFYKNVDKNNITESEEIEMKDSESSKIELSDEEEFADEIISQENESEVKSEVEENILLPDEDEFDSDSIFPNPQDNQDEKVESDASFSQDEIDKLLSNVSVEDDSDLIAENDSEHDKDLSAFAELTRFFNDESNEDNDDSEVPIEDDFNEPEINVELDEDDPFASLEKTFNGEIDVENLDEDSRESESLDNNESEISIKEDIDEETESSEEDDKLPEEEINPSHTIEFSPESDEQIEKIDVKSFAKKFGLLFWGIAAIFLIVTIGGVYFLFFNDSPVSEKSAQTIISVPDSLKNDSVVKPLVEKIDTQVVKTEVPIIIKETPIVAEILKKPETTNESNSTISTNVGVNDEVEVSKFIYTNGTKYSVQVSSWKRKSIADQEAYRFESMGFKSAVVTAKLNKLGTWYRVRVGYFDTIEKAREFQNKQK